MRGQLYGYLKTLFSNASTTYGTKQFLFSCEATKVRADAHLQNSLPGKGIPLKTTQTSLKIFWEVYSAVLNL